MFLSLFIIQIVHAMPANQEPNINPFLAQSNEILQADQAFILTPKILKSGTLELTWVIKEYIYLYKDKIIIKSDGKVMVNDLPKGRIKHDEFFGKSEVYYDRVSININYDPADNLEIFLSFQGCSEKGFCYPVIKKKVSVIKNSSEIITTKLL